MATGRDRPDPGCPSVARRPSGRPSVFRGHRGWLLGGGAIGRERRNGVAQPGQKHALAGKDALLTIAPASRSWQAAIAITIFRLG
jgi:hypothetical protein